MSANIFKKQVDMLKKGWLHLMSRRVVENLATQHAAFPRTTAGAALVLRGNHGMDRIESLNIHTFPRRLLP